MKDVFLFLRTYEAAIYLIVGIAGIICLRKFLIALQEIKNSVFGLERDNGIKHLTQSVSLLVLLLILGFGEFIFITVIGVKLVGNQVLATPTLNLQSTETVSPALNSTSTPGADGSAPTLVVASGNGCIPGKISWTSPTAGQELQGMVELTGTANTPDFGFYKYEYAQAGSDTWITLQAGTAPVTEGKIGNWDTSQVTPGDYQLRLVVTDNSGQASPPCVIQVKVKAP